ncbi:ankyrin repeat domain-containing protein [Candidatus Dependentiae bacterium]|nr:ankyrin repeat domain-containing protein [Candidatus Dependentiae bacterium]
MNLKNLLIIAALFTVSLSHAMSEEKPLNEQLVDAIKADNYGLVENILKSCRGQMLTYPSTINQAEISLLHFASEVDDIVLVKLLLQAEYPVNIKDHAEKNTPLHIALKNGHQEIAKVLLDHGADITLANQYSELPIHYAAESGNAKVVKLSLDTGINVNVRDNSNKTPLHYASKKGQTEVVELLLSQSGIEVDNEGENKTRPLHGACASGNVSVVKLLLDKGANIDSIGCIEDFEEGDPMLSPLHYAIIKNHRDVVKLLLSKGVSLKPFKDQGIPTEDHEDGEPLHFAAAKGNSEPLHFAAAKGNKAIVKLLLDAGAKTNLLGSINIRLDEKSASPLHFAIDNNHGPIVQLLIESHAHVNMQDSQDKTPLHYAVKLGNQFIVEMLLTNGAKAPQDIKANPLIQQAKSNIFALSQAQKFKEITQLLSTGIYSSPLANAFVNSKRKKLFKAIKADDVATVSKLLKKGFTLNTCDKEGNTLLHKALQFSSLKVFNLLLSLGAHKYIDKPNEHGIMPIQLLACSGIVSDLILQLRAHQLAGAKRKQLDS